MTYVFNNRMKNSVLLGRKNEYFRYKEGMCKTHAHPFNKTYLRSLILRNFQFSI